MCGFASNLQGFDANEVNKAIFQQKDKQLQFMKQKIDWGVPPETLPIYTWTEFQDLCDSKGRAEKLVCIAGVIYDVGPFMEIHPGGQNMILTSIGKDATSKFHGGIYNRKPRFLFVLLDPMCYYSLLIRCCRFQGSKQSPSRNAVWSAKAWWKGRRTPKLLNGEIISLN